MNKRNSWFIIAAAFIAGGTTPWLIPTEWLKYGLWLGLGASFLFGSLAAGSADRDRPASLLLWLLIGTDQPTATIRNYQAVTLFFASVAYLTGLALGAFGAVHA